MARISKLALFWRAFLVSLIVGAPATGNRAEASDAGDWAAAVEQGTFESYVWYLRRNPTGDHIEEALNRLVSLTQTPAPANETTTAPTPEPAAAAAAAVAAAVATPAAVQNANLY